MQRVHGSRIRHGRPNLDKIRRLQLRRAGAGNHRWQEEPRLLQTRPRCQPPGICKQQPATLYHKRFFQRNSELNHACRLSSVMDLRSRHGCCGEKGGAWSYWTRRWAAASTTAGCCGASRWRSCAWKRSRGTGRSCRRWSRCWPATTPCSPSPTSPG